MARTIDNLGVEISTRYAEDRELYDENFIKEERLIPSQIQVATTLPSFASEFDILFDLSKQKALWAAFLAPPGYRAYRRRIFVEQLIPALGSGDFQEALIERVDAYGEEEKEHHKNSAEQEEIEEEKRILVKLLKNLHLFDQLLIDINSRRTQYQKG